MEQACNTYLNRSLCNEKTTEGLLIPMCATLKEYRQTSDKSCFNTLFVLRFKEFVFRVLEKNFKKRISFHEQSEVYREVEFGFFKYSINSLINVENPKILAGYINNIVKFKIGDFLQKLKKKREHEVPADLYNLFNLDDEDRLQDFFKVQFGGLVDDDFSEKMAKKLDLLNYFEIVKNNLIKKFSYKVGYRLFIIIVFSLSNKLFLEKIKNLDEKLISSIYYYFLISKLD